MYIKLKYLILIISLLNIVSSQNSTINRKKPIVITRKNSSLVEKISYDVKRLTLSSDEEKKIGIRLQQWFDLRDACNFELNLSIESINDTIDSSVNERTQIFCPPTADYLTCFQATQANKTFYSACPYKKGIEIKDPSSAKVKRYCYPNGTWASTDYSACNENLIITVHPNSCRFKNAKQHHNKSNSTHSVKYLDCDESDDEASFHKFIVFANFFGFSITIIPVSIALFIFLSIRSLRCTRNMIHCNMLFTFVFKCVVHIIFYILVIANMIKDSNFLCVLFNVLIFYSILCSFFWMMIEAVYLITVIVAAYSSNKIQLWWYLIVGWVLPMIPLVPYVVITNMQDQKTCNLVSSAYDSPHESLIEIPIYILLAINSVLLIIILYVIIKKLRTHNDAVKTKYSQYKKLTRATLVLFPLFGLTFGVFFWHPIDTKSVFVKIYYCLNIFLQTTQGVWVAFVYCFFNDEVKNAVKTKLRSWKTSYIGSVGTYGSGTHTTSSCRHHSIPTLYSTQISTTNFNNNLLRTKYESINQTETVKLPILQEAAPT